MARLFEARVAAAMLTAATGVMSLWAGSGLAAERTVLSTEVDGRPLTTVDVHSPLTLDPSREALVRIQVTNRSPGELTVRSVVLSGKVVGLTFFVFKTRVDLHVREGEVADLEFPLDLAELQGQAVGLIPTTLSLLDDDRGVLGSESFPADVRGSLWSTYGVFGVAVAGITAVLLAAAFLRLASHRLPRSRLGRAVRFAGPGFSLGLTLTFLLSVLRILMPYAALWLPLIAVTGAIGFAAGWFTPAPEDEDDEPRYEEAAALVREALSLADPAPAREP